MLQVISYISSLTIILPLVVGLSFFKHQPAVSRLILYLVIITFGIELLSAILFFQLKNNLFLFHLHVYFEFIIYSLIFIRLIRTALFRSIIILTIPLFLTFSLYLLFRVQGLDHFNSIQRHFEGAILIVFILYYLFHPKEAGKERWLANPYTIFSIASLFYFAGSLFVFILGDKMFTTGQDQAWIIHGLLNIGLNIIITFTLWKARKLR